VDELRDCDVVLRVMDVTFEVLEAEPPPSSSLEHEKINNVKKLIK
jgi:hypothetical protein